MNSVSIGPAGEGQETSASMGTSKKMLKDLPRDRIEHLIGSGSHHVIAGAKIQGIRAEVGKPDPVQTDSDEQRRSQGFRQSQRKGRWEVQGRRGSDARHAGSGMDLQSRIFPMKDTKIHHAFVEAKRGEDQHGQDRYRAPSSRLEHVGVEGNFLLQGQPGGMAETLAVFQTDPRGQEIPGSRRNI
jgi:hypothetical protein